MNNEKISEWFDTGQQEKAFAKLYASYPKVEKYILKNSGSKEEALDVFQEALIILYKKHQTDKNLPYEGFLVKTSQFLWKNELRKKKVRQGDDSKLDRLEDESELEHLLEKEKKFQQIEKILVQVSKKCQEIFSLFYFKSLSMTEVAKRIGFKSVQSAKVQKYKCMEHARNLALSFNRNPKS